MIGRKKFCFFLLTATAAFAFFTLYGTAPEIAGLCACRLAAGFLVGGALALAGEISQALFRNELATPYTLGVSSGAALGAALAICFCRGMLAVAVPCGAFAGAALTFFIVLLLGRFGKSSASELLLGGVMAGTMLSGILIYLVSSADRDELAGLSWWMLGDLSAVDDVGLALLAGAGALALALMRFFANDLNAMAFGDEGAAFLGVSPVKVRLVLLGAATLLASLAVAFAGIIGFVGLIVPHLVRRLTGSDQRGQGVAVYLAGAFFLMLCDRAGRWIDPVRQLPAGVLTAIIGGTCFLMLLYRGRARL